MALGGLDFLKREFPLPARLGRTKVRQRHADQPDPFRGWKDGPDQAEGDFMQPLPGFDRAFPDRLRVEI